MGTPLLGPALAANALLWYRGQAANQACRSNWADAVPMKGELPPAAFLPVQFKDAKQLGVGKLLVASRNLADPNFAKTVILLVHSDDQGIVGLILNRRTDLALSRVLEGIPGTKDRSDAVYLGGPVEVRAVSALLQSPTKVEGADHIFGGVYFINAKTILEQTLAARPSLRFFMFIWAMRDGRTINYGRKWNWARGSSSRRTLTRFSIRIRVHCGRR